MRFFGGCLEPPEPPRPAVVLREAVRVRAPDALPEDRPCEDAERPSALRDAKSGSRVGEPETARSAEPCPEVGYAVVYGREAPVVPIVSMIPYYSKVISDSQ